jgi:GAF domain-containing protein
MRVNEDEPIVSAALPLGDVAARLSRVADVVPDALVILGADGRIAFANAAAGPAIPMLRALAGMPSDDEARWTVSDASGHPVASGDLPVARANRGEVVRDVVVHAKRPGSPSRRVLVNAAPLRDPAGGAGGVVLVARDVTKEANAEDTFRMFGAVSQLLASTLDVEDTLSSVAHLIVPTFSDWCAVDIVDEDGQITRVDVAHMRPDAATEMRRCCYPFAADDAVGTPRTIRSGESVLIASLRDADAVAHVRDEQQLHELRDLGIVSLLSVPLVVRGRPFGAISCATTESERRFGARDLALMEDLAGRVALAVHNSRPYTKEHEMRWAAERAAIRASRLQVVTASLADSLTHEQVAEVVLGLGGGTLGAHAGAFLLLDQRGVELDLVYATGLSAEILERIRRVPITASTALADAARSGHLLWFGSREVYAAAYPAGTGGIMHLSSSYALAAVPLMLDGRSIGALAFCFPEPRSLANEDRDFMQSLARQSVHALERIRLYEAERTARADAEAAEERLTFLNQAGDVLASSLDYETTLRNMARLAVPTLADLCIAYVLEDGVVRQVEMAHEDPRQEDLVRGVLRRHPLTVLSRSPVLAALHTREPQIVADVASYSVETAAEELSDVALLQGLGARSLMVVPLLARGRELGAVAFITTRSYRRYGEADVALAEDLVRRAALAVDNSRMYRRSQESNDMKAEFLSLMSREVRTPLTSILGYADLLLMGIPEPLSDAARPHIERVRAASEHLLHVIEGILPILPGDVAEEEAETRG